MQAENFLGFIAKTQAAARAAHAELARHENASSRIIVLEDLVKEVKDLPPLQAEHFGEAISALQSNLLRSAHVLSWGGYYELFLRTFLSAKEAEMRATRPRWVFVTMADLQESQTESSIIEVARDVKFIGKAEFRILQGFLATRNQCAHPTEYRPTLNSTLGYVEELVRRTKSLLART